MKRVKINFETLNNGNYDIIPAEKIDKSRQRIKSEIKRLKMRKENINSERLFDTEGDLLTCLCGETGRHVRFKL